MTIKEFVEEARKINGDKYDYQLVDFTRKTDKVKIICPKHGVFEQSVKTHLRGCGCCKCNIEERANKRRYTKEEFIQKARKIHGDKYDYSKVEYVNSITPVEITCNVCGDTFEQRPSNHINMKQGCPFCYGNKRKSTEEFIREGDIIHRKNMTIRRQFIVAVKTMSRLFVTKKIRMGMNTVNSFNRH